jgi:hypothetical protein
MAVPGDAAQRADDDGRTGAGPGDYARLIVRTDGDRQPGRGLQLVGVAGERDDLVPAVQQLRDDATAGITRRAEDGDV